MQESARLIYAHRAEVAAMYVLTEAGTAYRQQQRGSYNRLPGEDPRARSGSRVVPLIQQQLQS